jgi:hypothetical protein
MKNISRRGLLKGMLAGAGAVAGARMAGPLIGEASAAVGETSHFVHIFFNGGLNALFAGCADKFLTGNVFGVTSTNILDVGNGVFTDKATFGTFPQFALDHWGAVGIRHNNALHTTPQNLRSGGERAILTDGTNCYLNQLASHMGGESAFKAVYFGDRPPAYQAQPKFKDVPLERVSDLKNALSAAGAQAPDPNDPERGAAASVLETSSTISQRQIGTNPGRLSSLTDAYTSAVASLKKPLPAPVTFNEIDQAYGLGGRSTVAAPNFNSMLAGAEIMIRAAGTNVINICDFGLASWDFHQTGTGGSLNGTFSRNKFTGTGGFAGNRIAAIKTFLTRMLNAPDRNVVVAISGELVRLPSGDHGDGTVAVLFGKYVKKGLSFPVNNTARFQIATPNPKGFWAAAAAALKVPGEPFGANPHPLIM